MLWWSLVVALTLVVIGFIVYRLAPNGIGRMSTLLAVQGPLWSVLGVFLILPPSISEAVLDVYSDFRVSVAGPAHRGEGLTYFESLQV